jgi:preprotein translocase subunit SecE
MKFAIGITALFAVGASAFAPSKAFARSTSLSSTAEKTYTFAKSEEIFAEAKEVCFPSSQELFQNAGVNHVLIFLFFYE